MKIELYLENFTKSWKKWFLSQNQRDVPTRKGEEVDQNIATLVPISSIIIHPMHAHACAPTLLKNKIPTDNLRIRKKKKKGKKRNGRSKGSISRLELISIQISTGNRASLGRHRDCFRSQIPMTGAPVCFLIKNLPGSWPRKYRHLVWQLAAVSRHRYAKRAFDFAFARRGGGRLHK